MTILRSGVFMIEIMLIAVFAIIMFIKKVNIKKICLNLVFAIFIATIIAVCFFPIRIGGGMQANVENSFIPFRSTINSLKAFIESKSLHEIVPVAGNFVMLMPLGFFFNFYIKNTKLRIVSIFLFSVFIEGIQFIIGQIIGYNYRSIDIDDIILNTLGGIISYLIFAAIIKKIKFSKQKA